MSYISGNILSRAVGVFGISGAGKTSLITETIQQQKTYLHVQASELIKKGLADPTLTSEMLRELGPQKILDNQSVLARVFETVRSLHPDRIVVLDAHSVIDTGDQIIMIPVSVISDLHLDQLIFLRDLPDLILRRREQDLSRVRPERTVSAIASLQEQALDQCQNYASQLKLPLNIVSPGDVRGLTLTLSLRLPSSDI